VDRAAAAILEARRILLIGVGTSGIIAKDFWTRLYRVNLNANYFDNQTSMKMATAVVGQEDLVFAISHSGSTTGVISSLQAAREQGARTIGLTNYLNSPLAHVADILLLTSSRESGIREEEMTARIAQLAVMDAVFVTLANRSYERSSSYLKKTRAAVSGDKI
jgi:DNA-binding MurR/RpiR family transcriptional regulator